MDDKARRLYVTKVWRKAIKEISDLVLSDVLTPSSSQGEGTRYLLYSGHDQQIANILMYLFPNLDFLYVPYASILRVELR